ncbi:MAG: LysR family transcriptional regulator [Glaciimonas sp.]|nr:LysR family transcriptional regulator [Glaciimonas sp.]
MNVTLRQLRAFIALAQRGSFTSAADSMHVTQSALSGLIKELELALGVRLVDRNTRKMQLSEVGREFYPFIKKIVQDLDGVLSDITNLKALRKGVVRIAAPQLMACTLLPEVIAAYKVEHPEVQIRLTDCAVETVSPRVLSGEVDFGIGPERDPTPEIAAKTLFEMPFMLVFPKNHPLEKQQRITWTDAVDFPFIALQGQFAERLTLDLHASLRDLTLNPSNEVTFMTTALSMVSANLGITACLPYAGSLVKLYQLQMRLLHDPELTRKFLIFTRNGRSLSPAAQSFMGFLFQFVEKNDWSAAAAQA